MFYKPLGVNSALQMHGRHQSAHFLKTFDRNILIDCGEGTQFRLHKFKIKKNRIDIICISHLHGDHFFGLPGLLSSMNHNLRSLPLVIIGPNGIKEILFSILRGAGLKLNFEIEILENRADAVEEYQFNNTTISTFPIYHRIPTHGFRIESTPIKYRVNLMKLQKSNIPRTEWGRLQRGENLTIDGKVYDHRDFVLPQKSMKFAYCSDTMFSEAYLDHVAGVNLLYHEATFNNAHEDLAVKTKHSTASQAAEIAKRAGVGKLLIGHFSSRYLVLTDLLEEAREVFQNTFLAEEGKEYSLD